MTTNHFLYLLCLLLTAMVAGLFYGYQCSVTNGLGRLEDRHYLAAFQQINQAILNPLFFLSFLGSMAALAFSAFLTYKAGALHVFPFVIGSLLIYVLGVFGITLACNVPLNDMLAAFQLDTASADEIREMRIAFELPWNKWHAIRTLAAIASFVCLTIPMLKKL